MDSLVLFITLFVLTVLILIWISIYSFGYSEAEYRNGCCPVCKYPKVMRTASRKCPNCGIQHKQ
jgi:hypothetical protein